MEDSISLVAWFAMNTLGSFWVDTFKTALKDYTKTPLKKLIEQAAARFTQGDIPANHVLQNSLRHAVGDAAIVLAIHIHEPNRLTLIDLLENIEDWPKFARRLVQGLQGNVIAGTARESWLHTLIEQSKTPASLADLSVSIVFKNHGETRLLEEKANPVLRDALHAAFLKWVSLHVPLTDGQPPEFIKLVHEGWLTSPTGDKVAFYDLVCVFFRERLRHQDDVFRAFTADVLTGVHSEIAAMRASLPDAATMNQLIIALAELQPNAAGADLKEFRTYLSQQNQNLITFIGSQIAGLHTHLNEQSELSEQRGKVLDTVSDGVRSIRRYVVMIGFAVVGLYWVIIPYYKGTDILPVSGLTSSTIATQEVLATPADIDRLYPSARQLRTLSAEGQALDENAQYSEGASKLGVALTQQLQLFTNHPINTDIARSEAALGVALYHHDRLTEAQSHLERAANLQGQITGTNSLERCRILIAQSQLLVVRNFKFQITNGLSEAQRLLDDVLPFIGLSHKDLADYHYTLGMVNCELAKPTVAAGDFQKSLDLRRLLIPKQPSGEAECLNGLGISRGLVGRFDEAIGFLTNGLQLEMGANPNSILHAWLLDSLGNAYLYKGDLNSAEMHFLESQAISEKHFNQTHIQVTTAFYELIRLYLRRTNTSSLESAKKLCSLRLKMLSELKVKSPDLVASTKAHAAAVNLALGNFAKAEELARDAYIYRTNTMPLRSEPHRGTEWLRFSAQYLLGVSEMRQNNLVDARLNLTSAMSGFNAHEEELYKDVELSKRRSIESLIECLLLTGDTNKIPALKARVKKLGKEFEYTSDPRCSSY